jgi:hypothetical protein
MAICCPFVAAVSGRTLHGTVSIMTTGPLASSIDWPVSRSLEPSVACPLVLTCHLRLADLVDHLCTAQPAIMSDSVHVPFHFLGTESTQAPSLFRPFSSSLASQVIPFHQNTSCLGHLLACGRHFLFPSVQLHPSAEHTSPLAFWMLV